MFYIFLQDIISPYTKISFIKTLGTIQVTSYEEFKEFISSKLQDFLDKIKESFSKDNEINDVLYLKFMLLDKYDFLKNYNSKRGV